MSLSNEKRYIDRSKTKIRYKIRRTLAKETKVKYCNKDVQRTAAK